MLLVVNGGWGTWTTWTPCSETCGSGIQERHRECSSPRPEHGGLYCQGSDSERQPCHLADCEGGIKYCTSKCPMRQLLLYSVEIKVFLT